MEMTKQRCDACGVEYNVKPQNHGDQHRCGPKDWVAYQNRMLKMILVAVSASPEPMPSDVMACSDRGQKTAQKAPVEGQHSQTIARTPAWREGMGYLPPCTRCGGMGVIFLNNEPHTVEHCPVCGGKKR